MTISVSQLMLEAGQKARAASRRMAAASTAEKNKALLCLADLLEAKGPEIFEANKRDLAKALENGLKESFVDRLRVTEKVLQLMAEGPLFPILWAKFPKCAAVPRAFKSDECVCRWAFSASFTNLDPT